MTTPIAPATTLVAVPTASLTVEQRLENLEGKIKTDVETEETKVKAWFTANWPHFVTWLGGAYILLKHLV
jgi:hypothetical protein